MTTLNVSAATDTEQSLSKCTDNSISEYDENIKGFEEMQREMLRQLSLSNIKTVSMAVLYEMVFDIQTSFIGFVIGTAYQYGLLWLMVDVVFKDMEGVSVYEFDFPVMLISLAVFIFVYEMAMYIYSEEIKKVSVKEIMIE